jgi:uncharacterized protein
MQKHNGEYVLSASDLVGHIGCRRLSELNRTVADGALKPPTPYPDPALDALIERGRRHEAAYVAHCQASGLSVVDLNTLDQIGATDEAVAATRDAMQAGVHIIVQAALRHGAWGGRPDILRRVERKSRLGAWSYEALDTKLAREAQGSAVLQLCLYSELLASAQGVAPEFAYVVMPGDPFNEQRFRVDDFAAYYRRVKRELEQSLADAPAQTYPEPVPRCDICRWFATCNDQRRADDHLSFVAGLGASQIAELRDQGIDTLTDFAKTPIPLTWTPNRGAVETYERLCEQARIQSNSRDKGKTLYELLKSAPGQGLARLPEPSDGDIFLDLEGDAFVSPAGLEYLFGYLVKDQTGAYAYTGIWARTPAEEKAAFERFIDFATERQKLFPGLHIYHFAPYEPGAFKRLMGRYATREDTLDGLLRSERFVDLYGVVRNGVRCGVESYSIKKLEALYGYVRDAALPDANKALTRVQAALEFGYTIDPKSADCRVVERYNEDDCRSTLALRDWLERLRQERLDAGCTLDRPTPKPPEPPPARSDRDQAAADLALRLSGDVPVDPTERTSKEHGRWLLAQNLNWHRREQKVLWWEFFRLADLSAEELVDERAALSGLVFEAVTEQRAAPVHRYRFPPQETDLRGGEDLRSVGGGKLGAVKAISLEEGWVDIKKHQRTADQHPAAVFGFKKVDTELLADALMRIGKHVADNGSNADGAYAAASALLAREKPLGGAIALSGEETALAAALRLTQEMQSGVLPIQGPPGAGKTFTGGRMICALVAAGKKVGVTANSHKVITNLLEEALEAAAETGLAMSCVQKVREAAPAAGHLRFETDNARTLAALRVDAQVVGGTAWFWGRKDALAAVNVLFVDEAAQMSLANVLAVSRAAPLMILLGDPQQLEQPMKGSHPEGTDVSALDHILDGAQTIAPDRGLFLAETWRLHPTICAFTSELFYEGRLKPRAGLERQELRGAGRLTGSGLRYLPVQHSGNQNVSMEEVEAVTALVEDILGKNTSWIDRNGVEKTVTLNDILIVTPYNAHVYELQRRMPNARVGTVDKFQGQEAPIAIYSMASSSSADAPRGMEFLFSLNRLNVATSRARCACVLVASPTLFEADCRSPRQMQLANALCRYRELATLL